MALKTLKAKLTAPAAACATCFYLDSTLETQARYALLSPLRTSSFQVNSLTASMLRLIIAPTIIGVGLLPTLKVMDDGR